MPRRLAPALVAIAGCGALAWCWALSPVLAQTTPSSDLFAPALDAEARRLRSFSTDLPGLPFDRASRPRFGEPPAFGNPPGFGAGRTGFDSTNAARRRGQGRIALMALRRGAGPPVGAPRPGRPPPGVNEPATAMLTPLRLTRRGGPDAATTSLQNVPTTIATQRRLPVVDPDPYAPTGVRAGAFLLRPAIEVSGGYDSNPTRVNRLPGSALAVVAPELVVRSDWRRHALNADLRGTYTWYRQDYLDPIGGSLGTPEVIDRPSVNSRVNGRLDVNSLSYFEGEGRYLVSTDAPGSPNIQAGLRRFPWVTTLGGTVGYAQRVNRFDVLLRGAVDRITYQDSVFTDGQTASNEDRQYTQYTGSVRVGYELKPGLRPFAEAGAYTRERDLEFDRFGVQRSSNTRFFKVGSSFDFSQKLVGELAVGYLRTEYRDETLPMLSGPTLDGSLVWAATPLTRFTATATSIANEIATPGVAGVFSRDLILRADHDFRRWLTATARVGFGVDQYFGWDRLDHRYFFSLGLLYRLNREVQVRAEYRHDWLRSNVPAVDWDADLYLIGVRLQR